MPRALDKRVLKELFVRNVAPRSRPFLVWDAIAPGLCLKVRPSGAKAYKFAYRHNRRLRWFNIGLIPLAEARKVAIRLRSEVLVERRDPQAEKLAQRGSGTFGELCERYLEHAKRQNRSWAQAARLLRKYVLPRFSRLDAKAVSRADVRQLIAGIESPSVANATLAAVSAVFTWATNMEVLGVNPARGIARHKMRSRERCLADSEVGPIWRELDQAGIAGAALKIILLAGQRPTETCCMHRAHIKDGAWWELPGEEIPALRWCGTKNKRSNRVWLSEPVRAIIDSLGSGLVFATADGDPVAGLPAIMRAICQRLGIENRVRPHDMRRSFSTFFVRLGFSRELLDRVLNHTDHSSTGIYDRYDREDELMDAMEKTAAHIVGLVEGRPDGVVVKLNRHY